MPRLSPTPSLVLLGALVLALPLPAAADYYRYETENGSIAFTDDPEQIPARYRDEAVPIAAQSLHDWERTTRVEPRAPAPPKPEILPDVAAAPAPRASERVTIDAGDGMDVDVDADRDEPIVVQKGILRSNGQGTTEYTVVRQGDRVLMEVEDPLVNWVEP